MFGFGIVGLWWWGYFFIGYEGFYLYTSGSYRHRLEIYYQTYQAAVDNFNHLHQTNYHPKCSPPPVRVLFGSPVELTHHGVARATDNYISYLEMELAVTDLHLTSLETRLGRSMVGSGLNLYFRGWWWLTYDSELGYHWVGQDLYNLCKLTHEYQVQFEKAHRLQLILAELGSQQ